MDDADAYAFKLTNPERMSGVWRRLEEHLEFLLKEKRLRNDKPQSEVETAALRGEIRCLRTILAFGADPMPIPDIGEEVGTPRARVRR